MLAQEFIDKIKPLMSGLKVASDDSILLSFLNMAKDEIARDTMLWIEGEEITLTEDTFEYTINGNPIQIIDIYDDNYDLLVRNKYDIDTKGYFQLSPNTIKLTYNPSTGSKIYVNFYKTPEDYALSDTIDIPPSLHKATRHFMMVEALGMFKGEKEIMNASNNEKLYEKAIQKFLMQTDTLSTESLVTVDMIKSKGLI